MLISRVSSADLQQGPRSQDQPLLIYDDSEPFHQSPVPPCFPVHPSSLGVVERIFFGAVNFSLGSSVPCPSRQEKGEKVPETHAPLSCEPRCSCKSLPDMHLIFREPHPPFQVHIKTGKGAEVWRACPCPCTV